MSIDSRRRTSRPEAIERDWPGYLPPAIAGLASLAALGSAITVLRLIDGDTIKVEIEGKHESVRLIGVDTPETVHPRKPVERFGKEASEFTKTIAEGATVRLEPDPANADRDRYGRLLRYVYLEDGRLLNAEIIRQGQTRYGRKAIKGVRSGRDPAELPVCVP